MVGKGSKIDIMKNKTIYFATIFVLFVSLGIFGLQKDNIANAYTYSINFSPLRYSISFVFSLDKSEYKVGDTGTFIMDVTVDNCNQTQFYTGRLYIEDKSIPLEGLFNGRGVSEFCNNNSLKHIEIKNIPFSAPPGDYNAKVTVTRVWGCFMWTDCSQTKEVSIPYKIYGRTIFWIDPQGTINMTVGEKIQLKALYDNLDDSQPVANVTNL